MAVLTTEAEPGPAQHVPGGSFIAPGYRWGFVLVVSLFFLWALANNLNDILIRQFQKALGVNRAEAGFIQFAFYIGYFLVALPAGLLMQRLGYKAGILVGLGLYALGALLFYPASMMLSFGAFLAALFVIASGAACLETCANAYIGAFGDPARSVQRLNFAQAFNGLGGVVAPAIGSVLIFSGVEHSPSALARMNLHELAAYRASEAATVRLPYALLAAAALAVAGAVALARLPEARTRIETPLRTQFAALLHHRPLIGAVIAQFFYVGGQVGVWSFFIDFVKDASPQVSERQSALLLSTSLGLFMAGRFTGAAILARVLPATLLGGYALANVALCAVAVFAHGALAIGALMLVSFFMSIMFPTIFALGVKDLGPARALGSSCIIMAIIGGAIFPPIMGLIATLTQATPIAMLAPLGCFVVVAVYARLAAPRRRSSLFANA